MPELSGFTSSVSKPKTDISSAAFMSDGCSVAERIILLFLPKLAAQTPFKAQLLASEPLEVK